MPRYFFDTHFFNGDVVDDPEGTELPDADAAWEAARAMALQLLRGPGGAGLLRASLIVMNEAGEVVLEFPLAEAVEAPSLGRDDPGTLH